MNGNYYNDFECDLFDIERMYLAMCGVSDQQQPNQINNITININVNRPEDNKLDQAIIFY